MPDLVSRLILQIIDQASGPAGKVAKSLKGLDAQAKTMGKGSKDLGGLSTALRRLEESSRNLKSLRANMKDVAQLRTEFRTAQAEAVRVARALKEAKAAGDQFAGGAKGIRALEREYERAARTVKKTAAAYKEQAQAVKIAAREFGGINYSGLLAKERQLQGQIERTTAALQRRGAALAMPAGMGPWGPVPQTPYEKALRPRPLPAQAAGTKGSAGSRAGMGMAGTAAHAYGAYKILDGVQYAYDAEKLKNQIEGRGDWSRSDVESYAQYARQYAAKSGLAGSRGAAGLYEMAETYGKSGISMPVARGLMGPTLQFARYGDIEDKDAAENVVRAATIFKLPMSTEEQARAAATRVSDAVSFAANETLADVRDVMEAFKTAGPMANLMGMSPEQLAAMSSTMVQNGQYGPEAATAIRSMLTRFVKPTNDARAAMAELGINLEDYASKHRDWTGGELISGAEAKFGSLKPGSAKRLNKLMAGGFGPGDDQYNKLTDFLVWATGAKGTQDKAKVSSFLSKFLASQIMEIDAEAVIDALAEKDVSAGQAARIFDQRQGARALALIEGQDKYDDIMDKFDRGDARGASERGARVMMNGVVGDWNRFTANMQELALTIGDSGAISAGAQALKTATEAVKELAGYAGAIDRYAKVLGIEDDTPGPHNLAADLGAYGGRQTRRFLETTSPVARLYYRFIDSVSGRTQQIDKADQFSDRFDKMSGAQVKIGIQPEADKARAVAERLQKDLDRIIGGPHDITINTVSIDAAIAKVGALKREIGSLNSGGGISAPSRSLAADTGNPRGP